MTTCRYSFLLAALLFLPSLAEAQFREPFPQARISITPLVGFRLPYDATGELIVYERDGSNSYMLLHEKRGGGTVVGGELELYLFGPLSLVGAALHGESAENEIELYYEDPDIEQAWHGRTRGPSVWFFKAGLSVRLPEPVPDYRRFPLLALVSVGPAVVREIAPRDPVPPDFPQASGYQWEPINHYAVNVAAKATILLGSRHLALQFGVEDYFTFWNNRELERQTLGQTTGVPEWRYGRYHLAVLSAGFSLRF